MDGCARRGGGAWRFYSPTLDSTQTALYTVSSPQHTHTHTHIHTHTHTYTYDIVIVFASAVVVIVVIVIVVVVVDAGVVLLLVAVMVVVVVVMGVPDLLKRNERRVWNLGQSEAGGLIIVNYAATRKSFVGQLFRSHQLIFFHMSTNCVPHFCLTRVTN